MSDEQLHEAQEEVTKALELAKEKASRAAKLAEGWRRSRETNGFRRMIRTLSSEGNIK